MNLLDMTQDELMALAEQCGAEVGPEHCRNCAAWDLWVKRNEDAKPAKPTKDDFRVIGRYGGDFQFIDTRTNKVLLTTQSVSLETLNRLFRENS